MKKGIIAVWCLLFSATFTLQAQAYKFVYHSTTNLTLDDDKGLAPLLNDLNKIVGVYSLYYKAGKSKFEYEGNLDERPGADMQRLGESIIYKDLLEKMIYQTSTLMDSTVGIQALKPDDWNVDYNTSKSIGGFLCYKASHTVNKSIVAWFTKDLPIKDGPGRHAGLPGLIVRLELPVVVFELKSAHQLEPDFQLEFPKFNKVVEMEKYHEILQQKMIEELTNGRF